MAKKTGSATSTDYQPSKRTGSKSSTKDQSIKMKSGEKISTSGGMNETSKSSKTRDRQSSHESASYGSANVSGSSKVKANVSQDGFNASNVNVSKSSGSRTSRNENAEDKKFDKEGKYNPPKPKEPNIPITPKTRAKSLSEHLSQSSLRTKKSFMSISYRNSPIKGSVHLEPNMLEEKEKASVDSGNSEHPSTRSSKNPVKASSFPSVDNRKASSNTSMRGRISVSKLSLEKKGRRGSSRSFRIENRGDTSSGGNTSTKSPSQIPSAAAATMMDKGRSPKSPSQPPQAVDGAGPQDIERAVAGTYPSSPSQTPSAAATTVPQDKSKSPGSPSQPLMPAAGIKIEMHPPSPPNEKFHSPESVIRVDSSNITTRGRISVSKLSLEKEDRRRSSRSFKIENRGDTSSGGNTSTKSPSQIPSTAAATMPQDQGRSPRSPSQPPMTVPGTEPQDLETTVASTYPSSPSQTPSAAATTVPHDKSKSPGSPSQPPMPAGGIQIVIHPPSPPNEKFHLPESINRKVSSNISMRGRISVSKLSLEREGRRRSSRLFRIENRGDMSFGGNTSPKSPSQIPSAAAATMPQDKGRSPGSPSQPSKAIDVTAPQGIERASTSPGSTSQEPSAPPPSMPQDMGGFPKSRSQPPVTVPRTEPQDLETTVASTFPSPPSQTPSAAATTMPQEKDKSPGSTAQPPMDVPGTASQDLESTVARKSPRSPSQTPSAAATTKPQEKDKSPGSTAQLPMDVPGTASQDLESTVARQSPRSPSQKPSAAETTVPQDNEKSPRSPSQPPMTAAGIKIEIHSPSPPTDRPKDEVVTPIAAGDRPDEMEGTIHTLPKMDQRGSTNLQTSGNTGNFDDDLNGAVSKVGKERIVSPQNQDENVVKSEIKVPNAEPPQIKQSDADLMDEKESIGVSSVIHETKYEYDKHDSEQEFKRASLTNPNKIPAEVEKVSDGKLSPEPMEKKEDGNSSKKKKTGSKIKKRKSLENDGKGKHKNSQDLVTSNGSGEEKLGSTSPVISKEDIGGDNTKTQDGEDISERSLT